MCLSGWLQVISKNSPWNSMGRKCDKVCMVEEVRLIIFREAERSIAEDDTLFSQLHEVKGTMFCKAVADGMGITDGPEQKGATVE